MPSRSLQSWNTTRSAELDEIEAAHAAVGGSKRGRRYATQQINRAYAVLLAAHFQGFCRDLHSEVIDHLVSLTIAPADVIRILRAQFLEGRKLAVQNANPGNIGADFGRLGIDLWPAVKALDAQNGTRLKLIETLNTWRNAIAHHDLDPVKLGSVSLRLATVNRWRRACDKLASSFDDGVRTQLIAKVGSAPW